RILRWFVRRRTKASGPYLSNQCFQSLFYLFKSKSGFYFLKHALNLVITKIADASLMGVVHFFGRTECTVFNIQSNLTIRLTKRYPLQDSVVDHLHAE